MSPLSVAAILLTLASLFGFLNYRFLRLPSAIGLMLVSLAVSLLLLAVDRVAPALALREAAQKILGTRNLPETLLNGALSFLLFAGALHVDVGALWSRKGTVLLLATVGVLLSTVLFGGGMWLIFGLTGAAVPFVWCIVLGAILAPTDPVAVAGVLARVSLPASLRAVMSGESLFNDGVGVVVFSAALGLATGVAQGETNVWTVALNFLWEALGGAAIGAITGWIAYELMRRIDDYPLEIMISLALAAGTYAIANAVGSSGPIGVVVAGLIIGNRGTRYAMSERTRNNLTLFWSVIDELLNALLFLLLGFEILSIDFHLSDALAAAAAIPLAIVVRCISVVAPVFWLHAHNPRRWASASVLTWSGLRGGISVALALSLPPSPWRNDILTVCYTVVVFTIIVQGLSIERVIEWAFGRKPEKPQPQPHG